uniref:Uncharacterized protein n=1 Tax=Rhizophora mucronata TaxID=61149 RepID=A0A2P2M0Q8_RHIMU
MRPPCCNANLTPSRWKGRSFDSIQSGILSYHSCGGKEFQRQYAKKLKVFRTSLYPMRP